MRENVVITAVKKKRYNHLVLTSFEVIGDIFKLLETFVKINVLSLRESVMVEPCNDG